MPFRYKFANAYQQKSPGFTEAFYIVSCYLLRYIFLLEYNS